MFSFFNLKKWLLTSSSGTGISRQLSTFYLFVIINLRLTLERIKNRLYIQKLFWWEAYPKWWKYSPCTVHKSSLNPDLLKELRIWSLSFYLILFYNSPMTYHTRHARFILPQWLLKILSYLKTIKLYVLIQIVQLIDCSLHCNDTARLFCQGLVRGYARVSMNNFQFFFLMWSP